jgi:phospholipid transport system substrate-binding protein
MSMIIHTAMAAILAVSLSSTPIVEQNARDVIEVAVGKVSDILHDATLPDSEKRARIEDVVGEYMNTETMSMLVLARNWKKFDAEQRTKFQEEYRETLINTYWKNARSATFDRIEVTADREEKRGDWTVKSRIVATSKEPILIDYRLRRLDDGAGEWKIIDIIIEGVSLVSNYRSQYQEVFSNGGADHLIKLITEKNDKARAALAEDSDSTDDPES